MEHRIVHFITNQCSEKEILELNNWAENEPQEFNHHAELYHVYMIPKPEKKLLEKKNYRPIQLSDDCKNASTTNPLK